MTESRLCSFDELRTTGLLWLFNRACLHPRGYALAFHYDETGEPTGWKLLGDGSEPWSFDGDTDDEKFAAVEELLAAHRITAHRP